MGTRPLAAAGTDVLPARAHSRTVDHPKDTDEHAGQSVDRQRHQSLYGLIPSEIREVILAYALTETAVPHPLALSHDFDVQPGHPPLSAAELYQAARVSLSDEASGGGRHRYDSDASDPGEGWLRPDHTGPPKICCALLRTCRRIYLEASHYPLLHAELTTHAEPGAVRPHRPRPHPTKIRRLRLYAPLTWLHRNFVAQVRDSFLWRTCVLRHYPSSLFQPPRLRLFDTIRVLHLSIRALDWQYHDLNWPLAINPFANWDGFPNKSGMEATMAQPPGRRLRPQYSSWATAIALIPCLHTLAIDFETTEDKRAELERIVRWAVRAWRFVVLRNPPRVRVPFPRWRASASPMPPL
ncbi:uncharacterized protein B0T15DRAFT_502054 [Chaetomium strumarium]|uniref:Uncharacterized protein n=1 Tax=Chaetomium strumarium TaxID=1170767 RepID=A0AAJ0GWS0_9PEZI|nr:hypothetical protein B0T15DRAFT_502054 [Chaetomium strumarium]